MVGTPPDAFASGCFAHPTKRRRRVGKGALAPCPPSWFPDAGIEWWAHRRTHSRPVALPTLRNGAVGWAKAPLRRAHHHGFRTRGLNGGHATGRMRGRLLCPPYETAP